MKLGNYHPADSSLVCVDGINLLWRCANCGEHVLNAAVPDHLASIRHKVTLNMAKAGAVDSPSKLYDTFVRPNIEATKDDSLLQRAERVINGDRQQDYGDKLQNFSQIAMLWQGVLATKLSPEACITPEDVALCMIQVKISRLAKAPDHKDSILDVAGYAGCYDILQNERIAGTELLGATVDSRSVQF